MSFSQAQAVPIFSILFYVLNQLKFTPFIVHQIKATAENRELKQSRRRRRGQRLVKMNLYFTLESRDYSDVFSVSVGLRTGSS